MTLIYRLIVVLALVLVAMELFSQKSVALKLNAALVLIPLMAWWFNVGLWEAAVMEAGLLVFFLCYTYVFNWCFDRVFGLPASAQG